MRQFGKTIGLALLVALVAGCNSTRWNWLKPAEHQGGGGPVNTAVPPVASLVDYLNDNADRVKTLRVDDISVTAKQGVVGPAITFNGKMASERPRCFLMRLDSLAAGSVDLGSNNDEFWYWISKSQPAYQFYCGYKELEQGVKFMPVPFQPEWIMEALGIGRYGPAERYQIEHDAETIRLVERVRSPQGQPVRKVIVMRRREMRAPEPQVTHFLLIDETTNKEICSAHITETMVDRATGAIVPRKLDLYWRQENARLSMTFNGTHVNVPVPSVAFVRQPMTGVPSFNLARMQVDGQNVQPVQGFAPGGARR